MKNTTDVPYKFMRRMSLPGWSRGDTNLLTIVVVRRTVDHHVCPFGLQNGKNGVQFHMTRISQHQKERRK